MERNKKNRNKERRLKERIPKRFFRSESHQERDDDALTLSDELDIDLLSEFPGLKVLDEDLLAEGGRGGC